MPKPTTIVKLYNCTHYTLVKWFLNDGDLIQDMQILVHTRTFHSCLNIYKIRGLSVFTDLSVKVGEVGKTTPLH